MAAEEKVVKDRLLRGAKLLGEFWRNNERCEEGWGLTYSEDSEVGVVECFCEPKKKFCEARLKWCGLAAQDGRLVLGGEHGLLDMMTGSEWDATGMTVKFNFQGVGDVQIGPKGVMDRNDLIKLGEAPEVLGSMLLVMKTFPGVHVQTLEEVPKEEVSARAEAASKERDGE